MLYYKDQNTISKSLALLINKTIHMFFEIYNFFLVMKMIKMIKMSVKNKMYIKYIYLIFLKIKIKICEVYILYVISITIIFFHFYKRNA